MFDPIKSALLGRPTYLSADLGFSAILLLSAVQKSIVPPKKNGSKENFTLVRFSTTSRLYLLHETGIDNRTRALECARGSLQCPKIS